jgi:hypothetical protein
MPIQTLPTDDENERKKYEKLWIKNQIGRAHV